MLFKDILKEDGRYSQGRVYLFWSLILYYTLLIVLMFIDVDLNKFKVVLDALEYIISLFGGYVFGGKFINVLSTLKNTNKKT